MNLWFYFEAKLLPCRLFLNPRYSDSNCVASNGYKKLVAPPPRAPSKMSTSLLPSNGFRWKSSRAAWSPDVQFWTSDLWNDQVVFSGWVAIRLTTCYNYIWLFYIVKFAILQHIAASLLCASEMNWYRCAASFNWYDEKLERVPERKFRRCWRVLALQSVYSRIFEGCDMLGP